MLKTCIEKTMHRENTFKEKETRSTFWIKYELKSAKTRRNQTESMKQMQKNKRNIQTNYDLAKQKNIFFVGNTNELKTPQAWKLLSNGKDAHKKNKTQQNI